MQWRLALRICVASAKTLTPTCTKQCPRSLSHLKNFDYISVLGASIMNSIKSQVYCYTTIISREVPMISLVLYVTNLHVWDTQCLPRCIVHGPVGARPLPDERSSKFVKRRSQGPLHLCNSTVKNSKLCFSPLIDQIRGVQHDLSDFGVEQQANMKTYLWQQGQDCIKALMSFTAVPPCHELFSVYFVLCTTKLRPGCI